VSCFIQNLWLCEPLSVIFVIFYILVIYDIYHIFVIFSIFSIPDIYCSRSGKRASPSQSKRVDVEEEDHAATATPDSARKRSSVNRHGLLLTKSGRVAGRANSINAKYDSAYCNSENESRLLGR
jgi:hypothetical protein